MRPVIALMGAGKFGKNHLRVLKELEEEGECIFYGVIDRDIKILEKISKEHNLKVTTELDDFINKVDAIDIVTPTKTHYDLCKKTLMNNKHVFVEKPLTTNSKEVNKLIHLSEKNNKILMTGHIFRYNNAVYEIKKMLQNNTLGEIYYILGHFMGLKNPREDMGTLFNYAIHHIDIINYLFSEIPKNINCITSHSLKRNHLEDLYVITMKYSSNMLAVLEGSWLTPLKKRDMTIVGSKKSIHADLLNQSITLYETYIKREKGILRAHDKGETKLNIKYVEPLKLELLDFINSIKTGKPPLADGSSALKAISIIEKCIESSKYEKTVKVI